MCALAILAASSRMQEILADGATSKKETARAVDSGVLLERLLSALTRGGDVENALDNGAFTERRSVGRRLVRDGIAVQGAPTVTRPAPALTLPRALARLSPRHRQVADLLALGHTGAEIAGALGVSLKAAEHLIVRTRENLRGGF